MIGRSMEALVLMLAIAAAALFAFFVSGFATWPNLSNLAQNSASLMILSCGMAMVIMTRGLDLSQIAVMTAASTAFGVLLTGGHGVGSALVAALATAVVLGILNGWLVAYFEIPSLLATLATAMLITGGIRWGLLQGEFLVLLPKDDPFIVAISSGRILGVPLSAVIALGILAVTGFILSRTIVGRTIYSMGDNIGAARLTGLPVRAVTLVTYVFAAIAALIAGIVVASSSGAVDFRTVTNGTLLFEVIMVVVLGGVSLRGGRGSILSIIAGVFLIAVLRNGMTLMNLSTQLQGLIMGMTLITAIVIDNHRNPRDPETETQGDL
ncbi:ABC transporter permease [Microbaculum marinum]|uniref:ABC transporter permease n=1 Tax=Microbaculum marinum TaxID=1764581 RepID=A0AAW9S104_9HYPH